MMMLFASKGRWLTQHIPSTLNIACWRLQKTEENSEITSTETRSQCLQELNFSILEGLHPSVPIANAVVYVPLGT